MAARQTSDDLQLARLRKGDERTFEQLFHAEYAALCAFAERIVASPEAAEDVVQSVFLKLWSGREQLPQLQSLRAYLYASTRNAALDYLRKSGVERKWADRPDFLDDREAEAESDGGIDEAERDATVRQAIDALPERARLVVTMRWLHGLGHREIAEAMGISVKGVEIQITRALRALRSHFGADS